MRKLTLCGAFRLSVTIPPNTTATVSVPAGPAARVSAPAGAVALRRAHGYASYRVGSGTTRSPHEAALCHMKPA
ncbi:MAG TPA: alpha-L-rhamnosidase C-terminal domain-containing protein [Trebonia sp.]